MSDENYPDPECEFGVAIQRDIIQIKDTVEEILDKQDEFEDTLQNGLTTQVTSLHDKVNNLESEKEEKKRKEDRRDWEFKKMLIATLLGNILALGGGVLIGWLGFS